MTTLPFTQVDAFADAPFTGNPAAVIPLGRWLDDATLQAIAEENNLSETAFTVPTPDDPNADYALRWFTPAVEVKLCGHATLASGHVLMGGRTAIRFRTRHAGVLTVTRDRDGYALSLPAWDMAERPLPDLAAGLGGTPISELYILYRHAHRQLSGRGITVGRSYVNEYCTSLDMAGASLTLVRLDEEIEGLLRAPAEVAVRVF